MTAVQFSQLGSKDTNFDIFWAIFVHHLNQVQRTRVYNLSWENYRTLWYVDQSDLKTTEIHDKFFKGSIVIIHIYSLIYILSPDTLIERIVDLWFSLDYLLETQKTRPSWGNKFAAHLLILRAASPAWVLTVISRVVSPFFTTKRTSVEISIC